MKKPVTKAQIRSQIEQQIDDYLDQGGTVVQVERGISGRDQTDGPLNPSSIVFQQTKQARTYVPEIIAGLDARRQKNKPAAPKRKTRSPRKKIIYDDFGEPLRWEWVDE